MEVVWGSERDARRRWRLGGAGLADELALGGSEAGIWVCGFGMRAQGQRRPWLGTAGLGSAAARSAAAEQGGCGGGSAGVRGPGSKVHHGLN